MYQEINGEEAPNNLMILKKHVKIPIPSALKAGKKLEYFKNIFCARCKMKLK